jgi:hypothetical protein
MMPMFTAVTKMLGAQITPLIRFWDRADHPRWTTIEPWELQRVVFDGIIGGSRFLVSLGGYIATEETDTRLGARNLNGFLFALTLLRDHPADPLGENELDECSLDLNESLLSPSKGKLSRLGSAFAWYPNFQLQVAKDTLVHVCDAGILRAIAELADRIARSEYEVAFYEAHHGLSAKHDGEPIATLLSFWIVLEMLLAAEIRRFLRPRGLSDSAVDGRLARWNIPSKIRRLRNWNAIQPLGPGDPTVFSAGDLNQVPSLARVRNRVVHTGHRPDSSEVEQVSALGWRSMWRFFRLSGIMYQPYVEAVNKIQTAFATKHNLL